MVLDVDLAAVKKVCVSKERRARAVEIFVMVLILLPEPMASAGLTSPRFGES